MGRISYFGRKMGGLRQSDAGLYNGRPLRAKIRINVPDG